eukprot:contig_2000_g343
MDNLACHSDIVEPQVTLIELPPNTTAVYQSLDAGIVAMIANASLADEYVEVDAPGRVRAAQRWIDAENDVGAIDETVEMVLDEELDDE